MTKFKVYWNTKDNVASLLIITVTHNYVKGWRHSYVYITDAMWYTEGIQI